MASSVRPPAVAGVVGGGSNWCVASGLELCSLFRKIGERGKMNGEILGFWSSENKEFGLGQSSLRAPLSLISAPPLFCRIGCVFFCVIYFVHLHNY